MVQAVGDPCSRSGVPSANLIGRGTTVRDKPTTSTPLPFTPLPFSRYFVLGQPRLDVSQGPTRSDAESRFPMGNGRPSEGPATYLNDERPTVLVVLDGQQMQKLTGSAAKVRK